MQTLACDGVITTAPALACSGSWVAVDSGQELAAALDRLTAALPGFVNGLASAGENYFGFDVDLFSFITTSALVAWVTGHYLGRMMQAWRKVM